MGKGKRYDSEVMTFREMVDYERCVNDFGEKGYLYVVKEDTSGVECDVMYSKYCLDDVDNVEYDPKTMRFITDIFAPDSRF